MEARCDRCRIAEEDTEYRSLIEVVISIHEGEEGGHMTRLDYCDGCLLQLAPHFVAAGAKAPLVTGEDLEPEDW